MILKQAEQWPYRIPDEQMPPWLSSVPSDPLNPDAILHSFLLGPEDAYDQWDWKKRHEDSPPIPTPNDVHWYHATPVELPVGTVLAPHHKPPWTDNPYHGGLDNRANFIWVEHDLSHSGDWIGYMVRDHGQCFLYRVKPRIGPFAWNGSGHEGWVSDSAVITDLLAAYKGTEGHVRRVAVNNQGGLSAAVESFRNTPMARHTESPECAEGMCEGVMDRFVHHAQQQGLKAERREFNYPLKSAFPNPHAGLSEREDDGDNPPAWDGWHHAAVVRHQGTPYVVDWSLRQFDPGAEHPHIEPLETYGQKFLYHNEMDYPAEDPADRADWDQKNLNANGTWRHPWMRS